MERELMRKQMESIRAELNILDSERAVLEDLLKGYESWFRLHPENGTDPAMQLPLQSISFRDGVLEVLRQARGEPLHVKEIWRRMQSLGITSSSKRPENFVALYTKRIPGMEKVAPATFRLLLEEREAN